MIEDFSNYLLTEGGKQKQGLAPKTVSDILSLIKSIFRYAVSKGYLPAVSQKTFTVKQEPKEMRVLTQSEQKKLTETLFFSNELKDIGIIICLYTGLRIGELCALRWGDLSIQEKTISVRRTVQRIKNVDDNSNEKTHLHISSPKSKCSIRTIPLPQELIDILVPVQSEEKSYVLTNSKDKIMEPRTMQNHFKKTISNCSIPDANFHCLRHSFATRCVEVGFDIKSLSEILGHANVNITMNRYVHPTIELKRQNMNRLSDLLSVK